MFFEDYPQRNEPVTGHEPDSPMRHKRADLERGALEQGTFDLDTGCLKTIGVQSIGLTQGAQHEQRPRIDNSIYTDLSGNVRMTVEQLGTVELTRGDVIVIPCWHAFSIESLSKQSQLIRVSDEPAMRALGFRDVTML
jgi:gentisate 1,2-dioxygenase